MTVPLVPFRSYPDGVIYNVNSLKIALRDNWVDAIVTDPPYELGFMGKEWDQRGVAYDVELWRGMLRTLKPGGHLLAFGGSRTYHRLACAIEDAGFEIRDQIMWVYGSGFPKSLDVSKAIDKAARGVPQGGADPTSANHGKYKGGCSEENPSGRGFGAGPGQFMAETGEKVERELVEEAQQWQGWGTALKPAHEPIVVARKPLEGTVATNVLKWGTGAVNIDGCRVEGTPEPTRLDPSKHSHEGYRMTATGEEVAANASPLGRWPANLIHDGSEEVLFHFPDSKGQQGAVRGDEPSSVTKDIYGKFAGRIPAPVRGDGGSAARFFYCAKASKSERGEGNTHPTVKPLALMRYLCRLVTPPSGLILDPFLGSGTTALAARAEGFKFIGIEEHEEYCQIAAGRLDRQVSPSSTILNDSLMETTAQ